MEGWSLAPFKDIGLVLDNTVPVDPVKLTEIKHAPIQQHRYTFVVFDPSVIDHHVINLDTRVSRETNVVLESLRKEAVPLAILSYYDMKNARNYILGEYLLTYGWMQCPISKGWFPNHQLVRVTKHADAIDLIHNMLIDDLASTIAEM